MCWRGKGGEGVEGLRDTVRDDSALNREEVYVQGRVIGRVVGGRRGLGRGGGECHHHHLVTPEAHHLCVWHCAS